MTHSTAHSDPGPRLASKVGFIGGALAGLFLGLIGPNWASFETGKWIGRWQVNQQIDRAVHEATMFRATGHYSLREAIEAYEQRAGVHLRLRRIEEDLLRARIEATRQVH